MSSAPSPTQSAATVHPVDRILPVRQMLTLGLQHMAVSYIGAIAVPLIVASALKMSHADTVVLISTTLFCSGIATLCKPSASGSSACACRFCKAWRSAALAR